MLVRAEQYKKTPNGFTLAEIMIVAAIMGGLLVIAIPNFIKSRQTAQINTCIANLKSIEKAATLAILDNISVSSLSDLVTDYIKSTPTCPSGGSYGDIDSVPTCTVSGHTLS